MKKTYLVTGAAGFIGAAVARHLVDLGHDVVTIDNLSTGYTENIPAGVTFFQGDCQDAGLIEKLRIYPFDAIFHIAGQSSGEISFDNPVYDLQTNTQSTLLLLKLAQHVGCTNFIYASTMSVYGDQPDRPVPEEALMNPISFYGVGKIASEQYLRIYRQYGIKSTALRLFNVYGPGQNMLNLRQGMVSIFLAMALKDRFVHVKGSPERFRDFVYIDDVVDSFMKAYERTGDEFLVVNICTGVKTKIGDLVTRILRRLPFEVTVKYEGSTPGDQFGITGDATKAAASIGWTPATPLDEGLDKMVEWATPTLPLPGSAPTQPSP